MVILVVVGAAACRLAFAPPSLTVIAAVLIVEEIFGERVICMNLIASTWCCCC